MKDVLEDTPTERILLLPGGADEAAEVVAWLEPLVQMRRDDVGVDATVLCMAVLFGLCGRLGLETDDDEQGRCD